MNEKDLFLIEFGERVKERRIALNMTQFDLANKVGFHSRQAISLIEKGKRACTQSQLQLLAQHLNCSVEFLMGWDIEDEKEEALAQISSELSGMDEAQLKTMLKFAKLINKGEI